MKIVLLGSLSELVGRRSIDVDTDDVCIAFKIIVDKYKKLNEIIDYEKCEVKPGYIAFVDGRDLRLLSEKKGREVAILAVNHGGSEEQLSVSVITWDKVQELAENVARSIIDSGWRPEVVVGVLRGGIVPARIIADVLGVNDIGVIEAKLYHAVGVKGERPYIRQPLILPVTSKRVLVVDDISDSGLTLQAVVGAIDLAMPSEVRTATLYIKPWTNLVPDYYGEITESWIVFPWERYEFQREVGGSNEK